MIRLDHILWAAPDLDEGERLFERLTGVAPARGGVRATASPRSMAAHILRSLRPTRLKT